MTPIYFMEKEVVDSNPIAMGGPDEGYLEFEDTVNVYVYDLSKYNGNMDDLDYMKVNNATVLNELDSPGAPYVPDSNEFYMRNKEYFVDNSDEHSPREMAEIYRDLSLELGHDNVTKDDVKNVLTEIKAKGRAK